MYYIYMDSGTTTTRAYLIKDNEVLDKKVKAAGTKDSAINGSNDYLLASLRELYDTLLDRFRLRESDIESVWLSGMITNQFGITEVPHMTFPLTTQKLFDESVVYYEESYFERDLHLIRGAKTIPDGAQVTWENIGQVNSIRGEEIDIAGLLGSNLAPQTPFVAVAPSSHTMFCYVKNGEFVDVLTTFTGELNHALKMYTLLSGETERGNVTMTEKYVHMGLEFLEKYGFCRALQIVHSSKAFDVGTNAERTQILTGIITSCAIQLLKNQIHEKWSDVEEIIIFGGKPYIESYRMLIKDILPDHPVTLLDGIDGKSFALSGFLELLKLYQKKEAQ